MVELFEIVSRLRHRNKQLLQNSWEDTVWWRRKSKGPCNTDLTEWHPLVVVLLNIHVNVQLFVH